MQKVPRKKVHIQCRHVLVQTSKHREDSGFSIRNRNIQTTNSEPAGPKSTIDEINDENNGGNERSHATVSINSVYQSNNIQSIINVQTIPVNKIHKTVLPKKIEFALDLPTVANINPRSIYGKQNELCSFIKEYSVDCVFLSETWERIDFPLENLMNLEGYQVLSNPYQRSGRGGRPALILNKQKYAIRNITNSVIEIPWGVEAVWALLTPKENKGNSMVKKIALCCFYSPPKSNTRFNLIDHICGSFHLLSAKYGQGLHFILAGDANDMKLDNILQLSPGLRQVVRDYTRMNPPALLDPIVTSLANYYQTPMCLTPLGPDEESSCVESDHKIVLMNPINKNENICTRTFRKIYVRPFTNSGLNKLDNWFKLQTWGEILETKCVSKKAELLQSMVLSKVEQYLPVKHRKIAIDDQPWYTEELKKLKRRKCREYHKNRKSVKYLDLNSKYNKKLKLAKRRYKRKHIDDVLTSSDKQWYS